MSTETDPFAATVCVYGDDHREERARIFAGFRAAGILFHVCAQGQICVWPDDEARARQIVSAARGAS